MSYLQYVLSKVRENDLKQFKDKVEPIEKERDEFTHSQGLEHLDDIMQRRSDRLLEFSSIPLNDTSKAIEDQPVNATKSKTSEESSEDVFKNFLQTIRG